MQKIFSARVEESALHQLDRATRRLGISKRQFLEEAIRMRAEAAEANAGEDIWAETCGAWQRQERPEATLRRSRRVFRRSFARHARHAGVRR